MLQFENLEVSQHTHASYSHLFGFQVLDLMVAALILMFSDSFESSV